MVRNNSRDVVVSVMDKNHFVTCGYCGTRTFSRVHAEHGRLPIQCARCHNVYKWKVKL